MAHAAFRTVPSGAPLPLPFGQIWRRGLPPFVRRLAPVARLRRPEPTAFVERAYGVAGVRVRRLDRSDRTALQRHYAGLGRHDRFLRFLRSVTDELVGAYAAGIDPERIVAVGAFDGAGRLVGVAELHPDGARLDAAVSVAPCPDRAALGAWLLQCALRLAAGDGARRVDLLCLATDWLSRHAAMRAGFALRRQGPECLYVLEA